MGKKHFNQQTTANILGVQPITISRYTKEQLAGYGFEKTGKGRGCYYTKIDGINLDINPSVPSITKGELELEKMQVDIQQKKLKLEKYQEELFGVWADEYVRVFTESFSPLKNIMVKLKLDDDVAKEYNAEIDSCLKVFASDSKGICEKVLKTLEK